MMSNSTNNSNSNSSHREDDRKESNSTLTGVDSRFNQTLRNVQGLLKGRSFPGKVLITRRSDPISDSGLRSPDIDRSFSDKDAGTSEQLDDSVVDEIQSNSKTNSSSTVNKSRSLTVNIESTSKESQKSTMGARATDSARLTKFTKALSGSTVILEKMRELAWSGVPSYLRPTVWRLLLGYAPPNSDRREGVLRRKRVEYLDCVAQYYDVPDTERTDEEVTMLRQIAVDCPRTVPDVSFFQQAEVQKSLERILYTCVDIRLAQIVYTRTREVRKYRSFGVTRVAHALNCVGIMILSIVSPVQMVGTPYANILNALIFPCSCRFVRYRTGAIRHPASGYVQGINDLATPFLVVFLSEYLEGSVDNWSISDLPLEKISNIEADCYWCLSKLLDGMQDHYTFAQPGIQRLVFKLKELVRRIDEPVSRHMEEQGLEFLQFAFRWFNCLLIREWSDKLQKLDFQEMVMFLQHLPTQNWTHLELEMVLSRAYMWHTMFNSSPSHLAS
ncbi:unnamed protein product [Camellia sinensis]